jgi:hypothetical protein
MKYMILAFLFVTGSVLSLGISMNSNSFVDRNIASSDSSYLRKSKLIENEYSQRADLLLKRSKITIVQSKAITKVLNKYHDYVNTKQKTKTLSLKTFKIGNAMLELRIKRILNGKKITNNNLTALY